MRCSIHKSSTSLSLFLINLLFLTLLSKEWFPSRPATGCRCSWVLTALWCVTHADHTACQQRQLTSSFLSGVLCLSPPSPVIRLQPPTRRGTGRARAGITLPLAVREVSAGLCTGALYPWEGIVLFLTGLFVPGLHRPCAHSGQSGLSKAGGSNHRLDLWEQIGGALPGPSASPPPRSWFSLPPPSGM